MCVYTYIYIYIYIYICILHSSGIMPIAALHLRPVAARLGDSKNTVRVITYHGCTDLPEAIPTRTL